MKSLGVLMGILALTSAAVPLLSVLLEHQNHLRSLELSNKLKSLWERRIRINPCYEDNGKPRRCVPSFVNAATGMKIDVTSTCGINGPSEFCSQGNDGERSCDVCDVRVPEKAHPASYLTDLERDTYWQSETMHGGLQPSDQVNL